MMPKLIGWTRDGATRPIEKILDRDPALSPSGNRAGSPSSQRGPEHPRTRPPPDGREASTLAFRRFAVGEHLVICAPGATLRSPDNAVGPWSSGFALYVRKLWRTVYLRRGDFQHSVGFGIWSQRLATEDQRAPLTDPCQGTDSIGTGLTYWL